MTNPSGGRAAGRSTLALRSVAKNKGSCWCPGGPTKNAKKCSGHLMTKDFLENFQKLMKDMETLLGCWRSILLPLSSDPEIPRQAQQLCGALSAKGITVSEEMLKV